MVADKFQHLKYLKIFLCINYHRFPTAYHYLSLVSFLDASRLLETFFLQRHLVSDLEPFNLIVVNTDPM
jgi:hypothetical protein